MGPSSIIRRDKNIIGPHIVIGRERPQEPAYQTNWTFNIKFGYIWDIID